VSRHISVLKSQIGCLIKVESSNRQKLKLQITKSKQFPNPKHLKIPLAPFEKAKMFGIWVIVF